ncbi:histidinol-phosphate aminotransferase [Thermoanaerobacter uzonensis DSM 18761]|uniref:Histidinol-phosphate aminotransferase n=1 Tax=Thermoanaerobacter uzonensis DSM 18761 TaxID=1123369 RepID=A0A1M4VZU1_9THEO|nr:histidinol-phosphate transaminase [Thermoanaerobacter uzonensis]SHE74498.1 histidinol-phosphate aminotransferase [Thermoanaerobacter uzonensis DSM 18761]
MIENLVREEIKGFKNYEVHSIPYRYKMDANEVPFELPEEVIKNIQEIVKSSQVNVYPDPTAEKLKEELARYLKVVPTNIFVGNGSDEIIHLIMLAFINKGDVVAYPYPSFAMYSVYSKIAGAVEIPVKLEEDYTYDMGSFTEVIEKYRPKLMFLCNPNNPTGSVIEREDIIKIIQKSNGIVVVDEAYFEFYGNTIVDSINKFENLIVLRTLSKAFGLAGLRVGYAVANENILKYLNLVKSPYNINSLSQVIALKVLRTDVLKERINYILEERERLIKELGKIPCVKVYPSKTNFILVKFKDADYVYKGLLERGILVRDFSKVEGLEGALRITVSSREANDYLINRLKELLL